MTRDDVMRETAAHIRRVQTLMLDAISNLQQRAVNHDQTKFSEEEFEAFVQETPKLRALNYGSQEYKEAAVRLGPALQHHYQNNDHHPEHYPSGIGEMDLLALVEMLCDWKAAGERHADGNIIRSIVHNAKRFGFSDQLAYMFGRTALNLRWITEAEFNWLLGEFVA